MTRMRERWGVGVFAALVAVGAAPVAPSAVRACDTEIIRAQARQDFPGYSLTAVTPQNGIVTLLFTAQDGRGSWAVALRASGTRLSTSVTNAGLDSAELARVDEPLTKWWQLADLQQALVACCQPTSDDSLGDVGAALHAAAEAALPSHPSGFKWEVTWPFDFHSQVTWMDVGDFFFLALIGGVLAGLLRSRDRLVDRDTSIVVLLTALALLLRFLAHPGPADIREVISETGARRAGWAAFLHMVFSLLPMRDETIWTINRIAGALSVPLLYVVMRRRFPDRIAAIAGAAALAVTPLIVRFSASDMPYIVLCAALLGAVVVYDRYVDNGSTGAMLLSLGLLTAAMQLRPEAPWLSVPAALVAMAGGVPADLPARLKRPSVIIAALIFLGINVICMSWSLDSNNGHSLSGFVLIGSVFGSPWADPSTTPPMLGALVALGAATALLFRYRWAGLLWLAAVLVTVPLYSRVTVRSVIPIDGHLTLAEMAEFAVARYHLPAMYLACGLAGLAVATILALIGRVIGRALPAAGLVAVGIVCVAAAPRVDLLWRMWTPQREFEFFRDGLARVDPGCRVVTMLDIPDAGFIPFRYLRPGMIDAAAFLKDPPAGDCFVYYQGSNCYELDLVPEAERLTFQVNSTCRAMEEKFTLDPIVEAQLPAVPYRAELYARSPLPVGFYRLGGFVRTAGVNNSMGAEVRDDRGAPSPSSRSPWTAGIVILLVAVAAMLSRGQELPASSESASPIHNTSRRTDARWVVYALAIAGSFLFGVSTGVAVELGLAWIVFAVLLVDRELLALDGRVHRASMLALFSFSLLLHWALSSGGPGDLKMNLAAIWSDWSSGVELRWGPAPIVLFRLLGIALGGMTDAKILWCNLTLSSVVPVLLYAIIVRLGISQVAAAAAAFIVAAHPLLIAVSGVLDRQPTYLFAAAGSILALLGFLESGDMRRLLPFVLGAVLATASRPEGAHVLVVCGVALLLAPASPHTRRLAAVALTLLAAAAFGYVRFGIEYGAGLASRTGMGVAFLDPRPLLWTVVFSPEFTPFAWIALWISGLVFAVRRRSAWIAIATVVALHVVWTWTGMYGNFVGYDRQVASARYETILLIPFAIGTALAVDVLLAAPRWVKIPVAVFAAALSAVTFWRPYDTLLRPFTIDYEYRFLKTQALALPNQSHLYILDPPIDDVGFVDASLVGQFVGSGVTFARWSDRKCEELRDDGAATYLYIGSSCAPLVEQPKHPMTADPVRGAAMYRRWLDDCSAIRDRVAGSAVEEIDTPARKMSWYEFRDDTVRLGLYRLTNPSVCTLGWRASSRSDSG
jgi:hypothetical protein